MAEGKPIWTKEAEEILAKLISLVSPYNRDKARAGTIREAEVLATAAGAPVDVDMVVRAYIGGLPPAFKMTAKGTLTKAGLDPEKYNDLLVV